jgi:NTP pyrophosphatase (non-canonical NTP hydrolase)
MDIPDHGPISEALKERMRAHTKHGDNSIESVPGDDLRWLAILGEEVGEVSEELFHLALVGAMGGVSRGSTYDQAQGNVRKELVQVIAVAWAWVNAIDSPKRDAMKEEIEAENAAQLARERNIDKHHDQTYGFCVHGYSRGQCIKVSYV